MASFWFLYHTYLVLFCGWGSLSVKFHLAAMDDEVVTGSGLMFILPAAGSLLETLKWSSVLRLSPVPLQLILKLKLPFTLKEALNSYRLVMLLKSILFMLSYEPEVLNCIWHAPLVVLAGWSVMLEKFATNRILSLMYFIAVSVSSKMVKLVFIPPT